MAIHFAIMVKTHQLSNLKSTLYHKQVKYSNTIPGYITIVSLLKTKDKDKTIEAAREN